MMNTYFKYQSPAIHFVAFLGLASGFFIVSAIVSNTFFADVALILSDKNIAVTPALVQQFKLANVVGAIIGFLIPALLFGYFSDEKPISFLGLRKQQMPLLILLSIVLVFAVQPFVAWLGELNGSINFGAAQQEILATEERYNKAINTMLQMKTVGELLLNITIMALLPAVAEELFFRGSLQKVLFRWTKKPWLAIGISSLVFALLHGTVLKIVPIFTLGVMLGVMYHVTKNLWYGIITHFCNNAMAVIALYYADKSPLLKKLSDDNLTVSVIAALASAVVAVVIIVILYRKSAGTQSDAYDPELLD
jgi:membrane protease YdiL (CAAX protease family)